MAAAVGGGGVAPPPPSTGWRRWDCHLPSAKIHPPNNSAASAVTSAAAAAAAAATPAIAALEGGGAALLLPVWPPRGGPNAPEGAIGASTPPLLSPHHPSWRGQ